MECRLCLYITPAKSAVSIYDSPHPLAQRIWTFCRLQVKIDDGLSDIICLQCVRNLELFCNFRKVCLQSDETSKLRLNDCSNIKAEEDITWENESGVNSTPNLCNSRVNGDINKSDSSALERSDFEMRGGKVKSLDCGVKLMEIPPEETSQKSSDKTYSTDSKSDDKINTKVTSKLLPQQKNFTPLNCEVCSKSFNLKFKLEKHMRSHTMEKQYKCEICLKSFTHKSTLAIHERSHTGEKLHKCGICLKSFVQKSTLVAHERTHTGEKPYKCDICSKSFSQKSYLVMHERSHTGEKPYKCDICFRSFTHLSNLAVHERAHTGEKPYKCDICLKSFSQKTTLVRHEKSHTMKAGQI
ncbi:uncharacterized protein LOC143919714 [Arctopsyche grandis]|uniref:uncharacterized protein LOC143919714 n=1 Tax=Arctopsyche grandis TaxID=121162 RepID=UPI00406D738A